MKTKNLIITGFLAATLGLTFNACKKSTNEVTNTGNEEAAVNLAVSATASEMVYDDAFDIVNQSSEQNSLSVNETGATLSVNAVGTNATQTTFTGTAGATITLVPLDPSVFPKTMTIDYGTGVTAANGIMRKGQIIVSLSGKLRVAGSVLSVTFKSYSVNGYTLTGTYTLTPQVTAAAGVNYTATVANGNITFPSGQSSTYSGTETFTQTAGIGTTSITDDTYAITGGFSYSNTAGSSITATITTPLVKSADCKDITSGTVTFNYNGLNGVLDFGTGTCDDQATVKFGLTTKTITLAK